jgi:hypothetical protein
MEFDVGCTQICLRTGRDCAMADAGVPDADNPFPAHKSLTAIHPATLVAVLTARTIASANTSAAIAPSAVTRPPTTAVHREST